MKKNDKVKKPATPARKVMNCLKRAKAFDEATAVGYDTFSKVSETTPVLTYTILNLMQEGVVIKTEDDRYYYSAKNWKKLEFKVNFSYYLLIGIPLAILVIFMFIEYFT